MKLKKLLTDWTKSDWIYEAGDLNKNPLACFIHAGLENTDIMSQVSPGDIANIINSDKALFLLDGYDEISHLNSGIPKRIIDTALSVKNVVMTSRPNALHGNRTIINKFDRQVENIGLDDEGISQYLDKAFGSLNSEEEKSEADSGLNLKNNLLNFLNNNPAVKQICNVPINIAMLSLIWHDEDVRERFSGDELAAGQLYEEMIIWLGKRYLHKFKADDIKLSLQDIKELNNEQVYALPVIKFLEDVARSAFTSSEGKLAIEGSLIDGTLKSYPLEKLTIGGVHKYGILRPEGDIAKEHAIKLIYVDSKNAVPKVDIAGLPAVLVDKTGKKAYKLLVPSSSGEILEYEIKKDFSALKDAIKKQAEILMVKESDNIAKWITEIYSANKIHYFAHLTFQEYFTAYKLYEELKTVGGEGNKAAELIAQHRNEPRYLMTLKFLAGIVSQDESPEGTIALQRYWEAVTCNVDGVLELGIERKVTLLMNL